MRLHQGSVASRTFAAVAASVANDRIVLLWHKPTQRPPHWSKEEYAQLPKTLTLLILRFETSPFRVFAPKKSYSPPPCSIRKLYPPRNWKNSISGAGTSNCTSARSKPCWARMSCAALPPRWFSKSWRCIRSLTILIRALMQRAAITYDVDSGAHFLQRLSGQPPSLRSMPSMPPTASPVNRPSSSMLCFAPSPPIWSPGAPERSEPRARKRRPKDYQLLHCTKPRKEMGNHTTPKSTEALNRS